MKLTHNAPSLIAERILNEIDSSTPPRAFCLKILVVSPQILLLVRYSLIPSY